MKFLILFIFAAGSCLGDIIDIHAHIWTKRPELLKEYEKKAKANNITHSVLVSLAHGSEIFEQGFKKVRELVEKENNYSSKVAFKNPSKYSFFCSIPWQYKKTFYELKRCKDQLGAKGIKLYPVYFSYNNTSSTPVDFLLKNELTYLNKVFTFANKNKLPILMHSSTIDSKDLNSILIYSKFMSLGDLKLAFAHATSGNAPITFQDFYYFFKAVPSFSGRLFLDLTEASDIFDTDNPFYESWKKHLLSWGVKSKAVLFGSDFSAFGVQRMINDYIHIFGQEIFDKEISQENARLFLQSAKKPSLKNPSLSESERKKRYNFLRERAIKKGALLHSEGMYKRKKKNNTGDHHMEHLINIL